MMHEHRGRILREGDLEEEDDENGLLTFFFFLLDFLPSFLSQRIFKSSSFWAKLRRLKDVMESIVKCCVCNERMEEPIRTMPCLHSGCLQCLETYSLRSLQDNLDGIPFTHPIHL